MSHRRTGKKDEIMTGTRTLLSMGVVASVLSLNLGCAPSDAGGGEGLSDILAVEPVEGVPQGAVPMSGDAYAVPVSVDSDGCEQFSGWSAGGVVQQVIYYRDGAGGFSAIRSAEHSCNADMVAIGEDERGCAMFRAEQPDGTAADVAYYRSGNGYVTRSDAADCAG